MKSLSKTFFVVIIIALIVYVVVQQYIINGYEDVVYRLMTTIDRLIFALHIQMNTGCGG